MNQKYGQIKAPTYSPRVSPRVRPQARPLEFTASRAPPTKYGSTTYTGSGHLSLKGSETVRPYQPAETVPQSARVRDMVAAAEKNKPITFADRVHHSKSFDAIAGKKPNWENSEVWQKLSGLGYDYKVDSFGKYLLIDPPRKPLSARPVSARTARGGKSKTKKNLKLKLKERKKIERKYKQSLKKKIKVNNSQKRKK